MPQITVEYTQNLTRIDPARLLTVLNRALLDSGQIRQPEDIKSRAIALQTFAVGDDLPETAFVHVKMALLEGRTPEVKRQLAEQVQQALSEAVDWSALGLHIQLAVEVQELVAASYVKTTFLPEA